MFHRVFLDQLYLPNKPAWKPVWTYVPSGGFSHVMLLLIHDVEEDDRLLRSEFLAIVATIITRMDHFASKPVKHVYIPVRDIHYIPPVLAPDLLTDYHH